MNSFTLLRPKRYTILFCFWRFLFGPSQVVVASESERLFAYLKKKRGGLATRNGHTANLIGRANKASNSRFAKCNNKGLKTSVKDAKFNMEIGTADTEISTMGVPLSPLPPFLLYSVDYWMWKLGVAERDWRGCLKFLSTMLPGVVDLFSFPFLVFLFLGGTEVGWALIRSFRRCVASAVSFSVAV